jgi:SAM-dependent methyltransferase
MKSACARFALRDSLAKARHSVRICLVAFAVLSSMLVVRTTLVTARGQDRGPVRRITWQDVAPLRALLEARGITATTFPAYVERVHETNIRRVREGDLDHLIFYALQSMHFTTLPPIEPALSAKAFVESLGPTGRDAFLKSSVPAANTARVDIPAPAGARLAAFIRALDSPSSDPRLTYFRALLQAIIPVRSKREAALRREYQRVMRFVYQKEFVARRSPRPADAVAELYRSRGLSTDTAVEAGYLVYLGLGVIRSLDRDRKVRRVLIIGPGLDLAPRTALSEEGPPESYQPWAVMDALLSLGLSRVEDLEVVGADINPRVVEHLRRSRTDPPALSLVSEIRDSVTVSASHEYREYFASLGRAVSNGKPDATVDGAAKGHLHKRLRVGQPAARALFAETLDVVIERLEGPPFDIVIATNILPYFDDGELMLALANIAAMLAPGGVFVHNEPRPFVGDVTTAVGLPFEHSRHAIIATVRGAPAPLGDSVFLHRKR